FPHAGGRRARGGVWAARASLAAPRHFDPSPDRWRRSGTSLAREEGVMCGARDVKRRPPMRHADIAIVGGGLAGSTAAAMLGRAGHRVVLIDPHEVYPPDFRCEKLDESQIGIFEKTGLADALARATTHVGELWIARFGHIVQKRRNHQYGFLYHTLVNALRAEIAAPAEFICGKAAALVTGADEQIVTLASGEDISARLIVLANGLNVGLRHTLGIEREVVSECHSISIGFDVEPVGRQNFEFRALTYFPKHAAER